MARSTLRVGSRAGWLRGAVVLLMLVGITACGSSGDKGASSTTTRPTATTTAAAATTAPNTPAPDPLPKKEHVVVVTVGAIENFATPYVAQALGEFNKENLDVEIRSAPVADGTIMLAKGDADVQMNGIAPATMNQIAAGASLRFIASTFQSDSPEAGFYIRKEYLDAKGEPNLDKLRGAPVNPGRGGGGFGNPGALPLWQWFQKVGLKPDDVKVVDLPSAPDIASALIRGQIAIGIGQPPAWQKIVDSGCCKLLVPNPVSGVYVSSNRFLVDRADVAQAFFRALIRTNRTYLTGDYHKNADVVAALAKAFQVPVDTITGTPALVFSPNLALVSHDLIPTFQDFYRANGVLSYHDDLSPEDMIDTSVVDKIVGRG